MTSAAMVLGMLPTALERGVGSEFCAPMAVAVSGGVLTSTLLTLWVVPVVFLWLERLRSPLQRVSDAPVQSMVAPTLQGRHPSAHDAVSPPRERTTDARFG